MDMVGFSVSNKQMAMMRSLSAIAAALCALITMLAGCSGDGGGLLFPFSGLRELKAENSFIATPSNTPIDFTLRCRNTYGGDPVFTIDTAPAHGVLAKDPLSNNRWTYTPGPDYNGVDTMQFHAAYGTVVSNNAAVTIAVGNAYYTPTAYDQSASTPEDTSKEITLRASDPENDPLTYHIASFPVHGTLIPFPGDDSVWIYTPPSDYSGADSFTFYVDDGMASSTIAAVSIMVGPVNDPPSAFDQSAETDEDTECAIELAGQDPDDDPMTFTIDMPPRHGSLYQSGRHCRYVPQTDYHGADSFTFHTSDGRDDSAAATVRITVRSINDAPVATGHRQVIRINTASEFRLQAADADGDTMTYHISGNPSHGTLAQVDGSLWRFVPDTDYRGHDSFTFHAEDTDSAVSPTATVGLVIIPDGVIFVRASAPAGGDGAWWDTAFNNMQDAIDAAAPGDRLWITAGTYLKTRETDTTLAVLKQDIALYGGFNGSEFRLEERDPVLNATVLDGQGTVYHVIRGAPGTLLDGLTVRGGSANGIDNDRNGGGMLNIGCSPALSNCVFTANSAADSGGGIYNYGASPTVTLCNFTQNSAVEDGGALFNRSGSHPVVTQCIFSGNTAQSDGGAVYVFTDSCLGLTGSLLTGNSAGEYGGALCNNGVMTVQECLFQYNTAGMDGGALCNRLHASSLAGCTFEYNTAAGNGGAVLMYGPSTITNCTVRHNTAINGGGVYLDNSDCVIEASGIHYNTADINSGYGGGICMMMGGSPQILSCTLTFNRSSGLGGGAVYYDGFTTPLISGCVLSDNDPQP